MIAVEHISICPDPNCVTCALTAKIMDVLGPTDALGDPEETARRCTALAHAAARTMYGHFRAVGELDQPNKHVAIMKWMRDTIGAAMIRCLSSETRPLQ